MCLVALKWGTYVEMMMKQQMFRGILSVIIPIVVWFISTFFCCCRATHNSEMGYDLHFGEHIYWLWVIVYATTLLVLLHWLKAIVGYISCIYIYTYWWNKHYFYNFRTLIKHKCDGQIPLFGWSNLIFWWSNQIPFFGW